MPYPIERKLVVGVSSSALFDLETEDNIYKTQGVEAYIEYQTANKANLLKPGVAFPFIRRFLNINKIFPEQIPVEVVVLSKNSPETGIRTFNSIKAHNLDISRAAFTSGDSPIRFIPAFNISLFLSTDTEDVELAIKHNFPAGRILPTPMHDDPNDHELRVAFDFDGVLADDESEQIYQESNDLGKFHANEVAKADIPMNPGLLQGFLQKLSFFQKLESKRAKDDPSYKKILRTSIITARSAPSHTRPINTLKSWDISVDDMFFLGGIEKKRIVETIKPHLFLDDQIIHLDTEMVDIPLVHIPFGIANTKKNVKN